MAGGFDAVPDELKATAGKIGDVVSGIAGLNWQGPSGDYGHAGVQAGWQQFIDDMKKQVEDLRNKANEHGDGLISAAGRYLEKDLDTGQLLGQFEDMVDPSTLGTGGAGLGLGGGLGDALGGPAPAPGGGSNIDSVLNPGGGNA